VPDAAVTAGAASDSRHAGIACRVRNYLAVGAAAAAAPLLLVDMLPPGPPAPPGVTPPEGR